MTASEFKEWLDTATPGQVITYYKGYLGVERFTGQVVYFAGESLYMQNIPIAELADTAIEAFHDNKVHLFQRKIADTQYDYLAMKRSPYVRNW